MNPVIPVLLCSLTVAAQTPPPEPRSDRDQVRAAVADYVEALYEVTPDRIERSVAPELVKYGFARRREAGAYEGSAMTFAQLVALAGKWNASGKAAPPDSVKKIEVLDVLPNIACAKLTAKWGTDYMQLVKTDAGWRIRHVIWQTPPSEPTSADRAAIEKAATDYALAFYQVEPERIERSVHENLAKFGLWRGDKGLQPATMDFAQLRDLSKRAYAKRPAPKDARREVTLLDVQDQTAIVKLVGEWGIDYMHLAKFDDVWKTLHVLWQSHPETTMQPEEPEEPKHPKAKRVGGDRLEDALNRECPFSGDPIAADSLAGYGDKVVGFCNPHCRDKFVADAGRYLDQIPGLRS